MDSKGQTGKYLLLSWPVVDAYAHPAERKTAPTNPYECILSREKTDVAKRLSSSLEGISDYESFALWQSLLPLCPGTGVYRWSMEEGQWMGIRGATAAEAWKRGVEFLERQPLTLDEWLENQGASRLPDRWDVNALLQDTRERTLEEWAKKTAEGIEGCDHPHLYLRLPDAYGRPDPYHGETAYREWKDGKTPDPSQACGMLLQAWILLWRNLPREQERTVHWQGPLRGEGSREGFAYLRDRGFLSGRIRLRMDLSDASWEELTAYGAGEGDVLPELVLQVADLTDQLTDQLLQIARRYPLGGLRLGGVETDSLTFFLGHKLFRESLWEALTRLCPEEDALPVAEAMLRP